MTRPIASLGGVNLPEQFSYQPYVPTKRFNVVRTAGAVVTQSGNPQIVHGDGTIPWTIPFAKPTEFQVLYNQYTAYNTPHVYVFEGYWGENLGVFFNQFDQPTVKGRLFQLSGMFQVVCINIGISAECNY